MEELTKMVLESGLLQERAERYELTGPLPPLAIPATLHDSLMARLDRLATVKALAQLGATLGREFAYELLQAVSPWDEGTLQQGLQQLVAAEFLYQQGLPPQATYVFKHALIQDAAYQSLLKSTRQQYHQRIAQVLESRFPETVETQPELLAHHYTEAGLSAQAIPYWQTAGQRAAQRSAHQEAVGHLTTGVEVLQTLPDTPERTQQDLRLHVALGVSLMAVKGRAAPEVERVYTRARALCQQVGDTPQLFPVLRGLFLFYLNRGQRQTAQDLAEQLLRQAERQPEVAPRMLGHYLLGQALFSRGALGDAVRHFEQAIAAYNLQEHRQLAHVYGIDLGVITRSLGPWCCGCSGIPTGRWRRVRRRGLGAGGGAPVESGVGPGLAGLSPSVPPRRPKPLTTGPRAASPSRPNKGFLPSMWRGPPCRRDGRSRGRGSGPQAWASCGRGARPP